jgi:hypothetical protein
MLNEGMEVWTLKHHYCWKAIEWVHPTSTHVRPLDWGNKNLGTPKCMRLTSLAAKNFHAYLYSDIFCMG